MTLSKRIQKLIPILSNNKPFRYFVSGVTAFLVDTAVLNIVIFLIFKSEGEALLGIITIPKLISGTIGIIVSFNLNRNWTFKSTDKPKMHQSIKMAFSYTLSILLGSILITLYLDIFNSLDFLKLDSVVLPTIANFFTTASIMVLNYFIYKNFVFK